MESDGFGEFLWTTETRNFEISYVINSGPVFSKKTQNGDNNSVVLTSFEKLEAKRAETRKDTASVLEIATTTFKTAAKLHHGKENATDHGLSIFQFLF